MKIDLLLFDKLGIVKTPMTKELGDGHIKIGQVMGIKDNLLGVTFGIAHPQTVAKLKVRSLHVYLLPA